VKNEVQCPKCKAKTKNLDWKKVHGPSPIVQQVSALGQYAYKPQFPVAE